MCVLAGIPCVHKSYLSKTVDEDIHVVLPCPPQLLEKHTVPIVSSAQLLEKLDMSNNVKAPSSGLTENQVPIYSQLNPH